MAVLAELICNVSSLGKVQLVSLSASEGLSRPFEFQVDFLSPKPDLKLADFLGQSMTVEVLLGGSEKRYFNGLVARFVQSGRRTRQFHHYQAVLRPTLWFLTHTQDCKVFQSKKALDIVSQVLKDHSVAVKTIASQRQPLEYCVQYRESDLNFVSRLLEQEGIYYYFEHTRSSHEMVLCDGPSSHDAFPGYETIPYAANWSKADQGEAIRTWSIGAQVLPSSVVLNDFNFLQPGAPLSQTSKLERTHALNSHEVFDYPGEYQAAAEGKHYATMRAEEQQAGFVVASGTSDALGLSCGRTFKAESLPDTGQDVEYLVLSTNIYLEEGLQIGGDEGSLGQFSCNFQAMPSSNTFRPPRLTPKPVVHGPQTAMVVGPKGKDIHTDEHARVKVLFHWDRVGAKTKDEKVSCWVRVSQPWAGKGFGMISIPRVGDEVVVGFLEGDPDQPLITGRVYNAASKPPYTLPDHASVTGVLTRTMGSAKAIESNELRFEDKSGKQYIWLQAQKDFHRYVKGNDHDTVGVNQFVAIKGKRQELITKELEQKVSGDVKTTYERDHHHKVTGDLIMGATGALNLSATQDFALQAKSVNAKSQAGMVLDAGSTMALKAMSSMVLEANTTITLKAGPSTITIGPAGVTIDGPLVKINCGGGGGGGGGSAQSAAKPQAAQPPKNDQDPMKLQQIKS